MSIKEINGLAYASVKEFNWLAAASIKSVNWLAVPAWNWLLTSLAHYWKFDANADPEPDAHWTNDFNISWATYTASWKINWAYSYVTNDSMASDVTVDSSWDFSISWWFYFNNKTSSQWLINKRTWTAGWDVNNFAWDIDNSPNNFQILVWWAWWVCNHNNYAMSNFSTWTWYHLVFTYSTTAVAKLYRNWINVGTNQASIWAPYNDDIPLRIWWNVYTTYFNWNLDEIWYWTKYLSADDVTALYNSGDWLSYDSFD